MSDKEGNKKKKARIEDFFSAAAAAGAGPGPSAGAAASAAAAAATSADPASGLGLGVGNYKLGLGADVNFVSAESVVNFVSADSVAKSPTVTSVIVPGKEYLAVGYITPKNFASCSGFSGGQCPGNFGVCRVSGFAVYEDDKGSQTQLCGCCQGEEFSGGNPHEYVLPSSRGEVVTPQGLSIEAIGDLNMLEDLLNAHELAIFPVYMGSPDAVRSGTLKALNSGVMGDEVGSNRGSQVILSGASRSKQVIEAMQDAFPWVGVEVARLVNGGKEVADSKPKPKSKSKSKPKMFSYDMMMKNYNKKKESGPPSNIKTAWLAHYKANGGGSFKMHGDKAVFDYRVIYSWGESKPGKWMVVQSKLDGHWCGFRVPHGTGVGMTPLCAGYGLNAFHHGVHGAEGTNTLGFDLKM